jgi:excisionase family DNA binding protein
MTELATDKPLLYTVPDAAKRLAIGVSTAWAMISRGEIKTVAIGRSRRIPHTELERIAGGGS